MHASYMRKKQKEDFKIIVNYIYSAKGKENTHVKVKPQKLPYKCVRTTALDCID